jgi:predicted branched-subunit amino acid permease
MQPDWATARLSRRMVAALVLSDPPWALSRAREHDRRAFYLGAAVTMFLVYPTLTGVGVLVGGRFAGVAVLALLPALSLGAVIAPQLRTRATAIAVGVALVGSVVTVGLPAGPSFALTGTVGGVAGWLTWRPR